MSWCHQSAQPPPGMSWTSRKVLSPPPSSWMTWDGEHWRSGLPHSPPSAPGLFANHEAMGFSLRTWKPRRSWRLFFFFFLSQPGICGTEMKQFILTSCTKLRPEPYCESLSVDPIKYPGNMHLTSGLLDSCWEVEALVRGCRSRLADWLCTQMCMNPHKGSCSGINWACSNRTLGDTWAEKEQLDSCAERQWKPKNVNVRHTALRNKE